ncbi:hypothetical protein [Streptomyces sp. NPDC046161]|uniref:hypothetical protein n=1 Tax=Streptomyces sp. NPDC046161 TaxID=3155132 RepID=UPI0033D8652D
MTCIASTCTRELRDHEIASAQLLCDPCLHRMRGWLQSIPAQLFVLREGSMQREVGGGGRTGTRTAPLPGRLDTLNLVGPAAAGTVVDPHGDQTGDMPIAGVLSSWVLLIAEERPARLPQRQTEEALADWLIPHLGWSSQQPWSGELHDELHGMMRAIWGITALQPRTRAISRPCPRCDRLELSRTDGDQYTRCGFCGTSYTTQELNDDAERRAAA